MRCTAPHIDVSPTASLVKLKAAAPLADGSSSQRAQQPPLDEVDLFYEDPHAWLANHYGFSLAPPPSPVVASGMLRLLVIKCVIPAP